MTPVPRLMAYAPHGLSATAFVVAAARAGGFGVVDYGLVFDARAAVAAAREASRYIERGLGLRVPTAAGSPDLLRELPAAVDVLILLDDGAGDPTEFVRAVRRSRRRVLVETTTRQRASVLGRCGADGLVLAGHEAGGLCGEEGSLVLAQGMPEDGAAFWIRGGIGPRSAAGATAAGAYGVVLDGLLWSAKESPLSADVRDRIAAWDGTETLVYAAGNGRRLRLYARRSSARLEELQKSSDPAALLDWSADGVWPVGQDAALGAEAARRFVTVGGILGHVERTIAASLRAAAESRPLAESAPLAVAHATRYPIVQGPMTRVSDVVPFADAVERGGALPFLALALMRGDEAARLLSATATALNGRAWGVGILGFAPADLRSEQLAAVRAARPPFALIAGGRPDQARELEAWGIAAYLHVPSPSLLKRFLSDGARRFVLEGRECGGHVGPRSSFVLWEQALAVVDEAIADGSVEAEELSLLFAGGVHDARSAAAVGAMTGLAARAGVKIGVLMGTAYLFTREAVEAGAIVPGFQSEAIACARTTLLATGPGHEVRVSPTPFAAQFESERRHLVDEGRTHEEIREALERMNTGRLRIAAKGLDRPSGADSLLSAVPPEDQRLRGVYMVGQVAALRDRTTTIADLHSDVCERSVLRIDRLAASLAADAAPASAGCDIAIVGMAALMPGARDVRSFWENTLASVDAITEVPSHRWDWRPYFDTDPKAPDRITSKWGGFIPEIPFDPLRYGMPPSSLPSIEPLHLLTLEVVREAIEDAGYRDRPFPRDRTAVVLGAGGGAAQLAMGYAFRSYLPLLDTVEAGAGTRALAAADALLPAWTEDSFPGILLNVAAGRVANRFDFGGANYTVDAACGSSLAAAAAAVRELETGAADVVILGGADTVQNPFTYLAFSKTHAFSQRGRCRPFDVSADGIVISEGVAAVVLKRRADAERDGDRIYAVIKGLGASSDGRARGLTAPRPEGQMLALRRAYRAAGVSPATVGYIEAHGTGTAAGDASEVAALSELLLEAGAEPRLCAVGSVKSSIGHTKCAAGLAGLINAALALHHRVLPPTIGVSRPNPKTDAEDAPLHVNIAPRPWMRADGPRRAGVSAFGFGGTNFHAVLEAYEGDPTPPRPAVDRLPVELFVWRTDDRDAMRSELTRLREALDVRPIAELRDLARAVANRLPEFGRLRLAIVAGGWEELRDRIDRALEALQADRPTLDDPTAGLYLGFASDRPGSIAFLFPGQGSQYPNMLREAAVAFDAVRDGLDGFDAALRSKALAPVGPKIFPPPAFDEPTRERRRIALAETEVAQPAVGAASVALLAWLRDLGVHGDMYAGHSYGELTALHAAAALKLDALAELSEARGRILRAAAGDEPGTMVALAVGPERVADALRGIEGATAVNFNGPGQTVVSGSVEAIERVLARAKSLGVRAQRLSVACAFHSSKVAAAREPLARLVARLGPRATNAPVFANATASPYPDDPARIAAMLGDHAVRPVRFSDMVLSMHDAGARIFVEVGPGSALSGLVDAILQGREYTAVALDKVSRPGVATAFHALARLWTAGVDFRVERLTEGRARARVDRETYRPLDTETLTPSTWLVDGARSRPAFGPEPPRFGVGPALPGHTPAPSPPIAAVGLPALPAGATVPTSRVVAAFQETMRSFLDLQHSTMMDYLNAKAAPQCRPAPSRPPVPEAVPAQPHRDGATVARIASDVAPSTNGKPTNGVVDRGVIERTLLEIVARRTGYPVEMLKPTLDLEADLGIDSIKRVEILGSLGESIPGPNPTDDTAAMDALTKARTLGEIVDRLAAVGAEPECCPGGDVAPPTSSAASVEQPVRRMTIEPVDAPLPDRRARLAHRGVILVTDDERGVARAVAAEFRSLGHDVIRVRHGTGNGDVEGCNFGSSVAVSALLDRIRERGELTAIVHAMPLRTLPAAGLELEAWRARLIPELRGLFLLARAAADDLARAAERGGACVIAATALGGVFGHGGTLPDEAFPGQGAIAGLMKTLAREWPAIRCRVVDFDPTGDPEVVAADLVHESLREDPRPEVGYRQGHRRRLRTVARPIGGAASPAVELNADEPVVVSGGARGITAAVATDLARRRRPKLLLIGSGAPPAEREDPATLDLRAPSEIKAALRKSLTRRGLEPRPAEIERAYYALRRDREIRENLRRMREAGSTVEYASVDIRDATALEAVLVEWRRRHGAPVGLIHGAGVIQDKLIRDKTPDSFDEVVGTKVQGALNLLRLTPDESLRFVVLFSSVAGRFGNVGQADYAAANAALDTLAEWLDHRTRARVVSIGWGPWSGFGMVSELEGHLRRRGFGLIPPEIGATRVTDELRAGRKGDVQVVVTGDLGPLEEREIPRREEPAASARRVLR